MLRVEEGEKGEGFGRELSVGGMEGLMKVVFRGLLVKEEEEELGGGGVGVSRWSLGTLKSNVAACKCKNKKGVSCTCINIHLQKKGVMKYYRFSLTCFVSCSAAGGGPDSEATDFGAEKAKLGAGVMLLVERGAAKELEEA